MRQRCSRYLIRFWRAAEGIASIEFVLTFPILILFLTAAIDFGRLYADYHAISKSVRDATRYLTRVDGTATGLDIDCTSETIQIGGPPGQILAENARRLVMTGRFDGDPATDWLLGSWTANSLTQAATGIVVSVECMDNPNGTLLLGGYYPGGTTKIPSIVLEATVPFHFSLAQMFQIGPDITFTITHKMAHFGT